MKEGGGGKGGEGDHYFSKNNRNHFFNLTCNTKSIIYPESNIMLQESTPLFCWPNWINIIFPACSRIKKVIHNINNYHSFISPYFFLYLASFKSWQVNLCSTGQPSRVPVTRRSLASSPPNDLGPCLGLLLLTGLTIIRQIINTCG